MASGPPPYGPGGYPTPGAGYPPGGYPPGGYPPGGYPPGGYAPAPAPYQPPQPVVVAPSGQQDQQQQSSVVVVGGGQNTIQGNCPACKVKYHLWSFNMPVYVCVHVSVWDTLFGDLVCFIDVVLKHSHMNICWALVRVWLISPAYSDF